MEVFSITKSLSVSAKKIVELSASLIDRLKNRFGDGAAPLFTELEPSLTVFVPKTITASGDSKELGCLFDGLIFTVLPGKLIEVLHSILHGSDTLQPLITEMSLITLTTLITPCRRLKIRIQVSEMNKWIRLTLIRLINLLNW